MTITQARTALSHFGMTIRRTSGEFRVAPRVVVGTAIDRHFAERVSYYTNDLQDAVVTAKLMAHNFGLIW